MSVTFTPNVPLASQKIDATQSIINNNFLCLDNSVNGFTVDHVSMTDTSNGGKHQQITFNANNVPGVAPSGNVSITYTNVGVADAAHPQLFWKNADSSFHLSGIRAWASITEAGGISSAQSYNVASATRNSTGTYTITLTAGSTSSSAYAVLVTAQPNSGNFVNVVSYSILSTTQVRVFINQPENTANPRNAPFSIVVIQI